MVLPRQLFLGMIVAMAVGAGAFADEGTVEVAQSTKSPPAAQDDLVYLPLVESLMDHVGEGRIDEAVAIIEKDTSKGVPEGGRENLRRILSQVYSLGGDYEGHEVVAVKRLTSRLHRVYALAYHQRQPLVYTFTMYQFDGAWKINHVHWDDKIDRLEEAAR